MIQIRLAETKTTVCEHCFKATSQAYIIQKGNFHIRVGSSCIQTYIKLKTDLIHWIQKELHETDAMQKQLEAIENAFYEKDVVRLEEAMKTLPWHVTDPIAMSAAETWMDILNFRINKRLKRVDAVL